MKILRATLLGKGTSSLLTITVMIYAVLSFLKTQMHVWHLLRIMVMGATIHCKKDCSYILTVDKCDICINSKTWNPAGNTVLPLMLQYLVEFEPGLEGLIRILMKHDCRPKFSYNNQAGNGAIFNERSSAYELNSTFQRISV